MEVSTLKLIEYADVDATSHVAHKTNVARNENLAKLQAGYLFPEVCSEFCF